MIYYIYPCKIEHSKNYKSKLISYDRLSGEESILLGVENKILSLEGYHHYWDNDGILDVCLCCNEIDWLSVSQ